MADTVFAPALESIPRARSPAGDMLTKPFLDVCRLVLPVIDKFGTAMAMVKSDVGGNISRLDQRYDSDNAAYEKLYDIVKREIAAGRAKDSSSCSNALLWLTRCDLHSSAQLWQSSEEQRVSGEGLGSCGTFDSMPVFRTASFSCNTLTGYSNMVRAMDFLVELFHNLLAHPDWTMSQAANEAYGSTLKKWHGWIASAAFTMAMKFVPDRKKFMDLLGGGNLNADIESFVSSFAPLLQENHKFLKSVGLDDMKAS